MQTVTALTSFVHGNQQLNAGDVDKFSPSTAAELIAGGLVRDGGEVAEVVKPAAKPAKAAGNKKAADSAAPTLDAGASASAPAAKIEPVLDASGSESSGQTESSAGNPAAA